MKQYRISRRLGAVFLCFALMTGIFQPEVFAEETEVTEGASQCICETLCTEGNIRSDCPVCGAKDADLSLCGSEALNAAYEQVQAAYEAYDNLTDEQKAQVTGADFDALFAVFDSITDVSENTGDFIVTGDASGYSYDAETHVLTVNDGADITISGTDYAGSYRGSRQCSCCYYTERRGYSIQRRKRQLRFCG